MDLSCAGSLTKRTDLAEMRWADNMQPVVVRARQLTVLVSALIALYVGGSPRPARAAGICTSLTPSGVSFGTYNPLSGTVVKGAGTIRYTCIANSPVISLSAGSSGTFSNRAMLGPAGNKLLYNIYRDAALTQVWGDGSAGTYTVAGGTGFNVSVSMYGAIFASQDVAPGAYADTITVVINY